MRDFRALDREARGGGADPLQHASARPSSPQMSRFARLFERNYSQKLGNMMLMGTFSLAAITPTGRGWLISKVRVDGLCSDSDQAAGSPRCCDSNARMVRGSVDRCKKLERKVTRRTANGHLACTCMLLKRPQMWRPALRMAWVMHLRRIASPIDSIWNNLGTETKTNPMRHGGEARI